MNIYSMIRKTAFIAVLILPFTLAALSLTARANNRNELKSKRVEYILSGSGTQKCTCYFTDAWLSDIIIHVQEPDTYFK